MLEEELDSDGGIGDEFVPEQFAIPTSSTG